MTSKLAKLFTKDFAGFRKDVETRIEGLVETKLSEMLSQRNGKQLKEDSNDFEDVPSIEKKLKDMKEGEKTTIHGFPCERFKGGWKMMDENGEETMLMDSEHDAALWINKHK